MARRAPVDLAWWGGLGLVAAAAWLVVGTWNPDSPGFQVCVFRTLTDLPCPGCGLTRAMSHLARGSLSRAFELHPLAPLFALEAGLGWAAWGVLGRERLAPWFSRHAETLVIFHAVPLVALWLGRAATGTLPF